MEISYETVREIENRIHNLELIVQDLLTQLGQVPEEETPAPAPQQPKTVAQRLATKKR